MVIYFTEEDLISFGTYMISTERRKMIESNPEFDSYTLHQRLSQVSDADIQNWAMLMSQKA